MRKNTLARLKKETTALADCPKAQEKGLTAIGGSQSLDWNIMLGSQVAQALWVKNSDDESIKRQVNATADALIGIDPKDELEGMMAVQLLSAHNAAMECYRRAMLGEQTPEGRRENLNQANKLSRTWATLLEAFNRHRGKGHQKVTVEHVHVHAGGQAVVGVVETSGGGDRTKLEEQPHAKQIAHAQEPTLRSADAEREPVPIARDEKRTLQNARRKVAGCAEG